MFAVKDIIFNFFGRYYNRTDPNKDNEGKGTLERYMKALATDLDDNIVFKINEILQDTLVPSTVLEKFIPYLENNLGGSVEINNDIELKRKVLKSIIRIYQIRGTKKSYKVLLRLLGFDTVSIVELPPSGGFDSPTTFDSDDRTFDSSCPTCSGYELELTGVGELTVEDLSGIYNIIEFCEPINAVLEKLSYNGDELPNQIIINIFVDDEGELVYEIGDDASIVITITDEGDLEITGDTEGHYSLNDEGDLIYTP